eukprot:7153275-Prymnesium_polylepis.1
MDTTLKVALYPTGQQKESKRVGAAISDAVRLARALRSAIHSPCCRSVRPSCGQSPRLIGQCLEGYLSEIKWF